MNKYLIPTITIASVPFSVLAATGIPGVTAGAAPPEFIGQIYNFALTISGVLALGAIVYGGIKYMMAAGNPSGQTEGKEWVRGAISGLVLLFGAYMILNFINPQITTLTLPSLANLPPPSTTTGGTTGGLTDVQARTLLSAAGVEANGISLEGIQQSTVNELISLKQTCSCIVIVTSATGDAHGTNNQCSHANGFKADLRPNLSIDRFVTGLASAGTRVDGAPLYYRAGGGLYADERTKPPRCGANCKWTAPHWDMEVGC